MKKNRRTASGSILVLILCVAAFIIVPLVMLLAHLGKFSIYHERAQNVIDAAALLAAKDLSRIVINDPKFGYVSLSNYPAMGKATRARDGEPLPVTGINTLVGTVRQNAIIADELQNATMNSLVDKDLFALQSTIKVLNGTMYEAISEKTNKNCFDVEGTRVDPVRDVETFLKENLPRNMQLESIKFSIGWLEGGGETTIAVPQPISKARLRISEIQDGNYEAFTAFPVGGRQFSFAGLGAQPHLVSSRTFQDYDGKHICSIVKMECTVVTNDSSKSKVHCVVCSQPCTRPDLRSPGAMTVRFSGRPVPGLLSWNDFLSSGSFQDNKTTVYDVFGGDFPLDKEAHIHKSLNQETQFSTAEQFAEHLYFWLRNGRLRPRLDSILSMMNEPFLAGVNEVYTYEIADNGNIVRKVVDAAGFTRSVVADGQFFAMSDTRVRSGAGAVVIFRDNVRSLGSVNGKHAGQPLAAYPLNHQDPWSDQSALTSDFAKRSSHPDGLALDIEIGGAGDSTAKNDVISMRERTRSRKI